MTEKLSQVSCICASHAAPLDCGAFRLRTVLHTVSLQHVVYDRVCVCVCMSVQCTVQRSYCTSYGMCDVSAWDVGSGTQ